jgi:hypothetical protein
MSYTKEDNMLDIRGALKAYEMALATENLGKIDSALKEIDDLIKTIAIENENEKSLMKYLLEGEKGYFKGLNELNDIHSSLAEEKSRSDKRRSTDALLGYQANPLAAAKQIKATQDKNPDKAREKSELELLSERLAEELKDKQSKLAQPELNQNAQRKDSDTQNRSKSPSFESLKSRFEQPQTPIDNEKNLRHVIQRSQTITDRKNSFEKISHNQRALSSRAEHSPSQSQSFTQRVKSQQGLGDNLVKGLQQNLKSKEKGVLKAEQVLAQRRDSQSKNNSGRT